MISLQLDRPHAVALARDTARHGCELLIASARFHREYPKAYDFPMLRDEADDLVSRIIHAFNPEVSQWSS